MNHILTNAMTFQNWLDNLIKMVMAGASCESNSKVGMLYNNMLEILGSLNDRGVSSMSWFLEAVGCGIEGRVFCGSIGVGIVGGRGTSVEC